MSALLLPLISPILILKAALGDAFPKISGRFVVIVSDAFGFSIVSILELVWPDDAELSPKLPPILDFPLVEPSLFVPTIISGTGLLNEVLPVIWVVTPSGEKTMISSLTLSKGLNQSV